MGSCQTRLAESFPGLAKVHASMEMNPERGDEALTGLAGVRFCLSPLLRTRSRARNAQQIAIAAKRELVCARNCKREGAGYSMNGLVLQPEPQEKPFWKKVWLKLRLPVCIVIAFSAGMIVASCGRGPPPPPSLNEPEFTRTPHISLPSDHFPQPGESFEVRVYLDRTSHFLGEHGSDVVVSEPDLPDVLQFSVWLEGSPQFEINSKPVQYLQINRSNARSTEAVYQVRVKDDAKDLAKAKLTAYFSYNQRPVGFVTRELQQGPTAEKGNVSAKPSEKAPDLTVGIRMEGPGQYKCTVNTPHLTDYDDQPVLWALNKDPEQFVKDQMKPFTEAPKAQERLLSLRAAGINFYKAAPLNFKIVLWKLIQRGALNTIYIVTDEPFIPWELMIPSQPDNPAVYRQPLGVEFAVGRWITNPWISPPQHVSINSALVVAVPFKETETDKLVADEVTQVMDAVPGEQVTPPTLERLQELLKWSHADLLHFICHGKSGWGPGRQVLILDSSELDSALMPALGGFDSFFQRNTSPIIFLNTCEVGSLEPALVGVGGFPEAFISLKAGAVIAPLWSVDQTVAHDVASEFYSRLNEPNTSMATIIRDIRRKAYSEGKHMGEDSYAAYCFYGDPLCTRERVVVDKRILGNRGKEDSNKIEK